MAGTMYEQILWHVPQPGIALITLNRPERLNRFTHTMISEWTDAIERARRDPGIRVAVVTGAGESFCAGADVPVQPSGSLHDFSELEGKVATVERPTLLEESLNRMTRALVGFEKLYIAAINGECVGGGMEVANLTDIRIASDQARFRALLAGQGSCLGKLACYTLPRIVGASKAIELICAGDLIDAHEACYIGYVSKVVPQEQLLTATMELARRLAQGPSVSVLLAKRLVYRARYMYGGAPLDMIPLTPLATRLTSN